MLRTIPLFGTGSVAQAQRVSAQQLTNLYREPAQEKGPFYLACTPGLTLFANVSIYPSRGAVSVNNVIYSVHDSTLYRINSSGGVAAIGQIDTGQGPVSFAWNSTNGAPEARTDWTGQLVLVDGTDAWIYENNSFSRITAHPPKPTSVTFFASYFIVNEGDSGRFWWSDALDGAVWPGDNFATAESETDNLVAVASDHGSLILFGERTTEFWGADHGATIARNAFVRIGGSGIEWGCASMLTLARLDAGVVFLGKNLMGECRVGQLNGYTFEPLDGPEESRAINAAPDMSAATAFSYVMNGHAFYEINIGGISHLYDSLTKSWSRTSSGTAGERHRANLRVALSQEPYVFDYETGYLYRLDKNNLTDNGLTIVREVTSKHVFQDANRLVIWELVVDCETGKVLLPPHPPRAPTPVLRDFGEPVAPEPQMMLQVSKDGGYTFGSEEWRSLGGQGEWGRRVKWNRLGLARDFVMRLRVTDPVPVVITSAQAAVGVE